MARSFYDFCATNPNAAQAILERKGRKIAALRARGICTHGWLQGPPGPASAPCSDVTCLHCGAKWATMAEAYAAGRKAMES